MQPTPSFNDFPLDHRLLKALEVKQLVTPTEIQQQAIPHGLLYKDLLASSQTGSGKTLAFLLPAVHRLLRTKALSKKDPRALILAPTRELAKQVFLQLKWLVANTPIKIGLILGGENFNDQVKLLRRNPDILVGTAGRVADHLKGKSLFLNGLELLILDEADRMLDLGFSQELMQIHQAADHRKRQTMMFSATLDSAALHNLTHTLLKAPQRIAVGQANAQHQDIDQHFYLADHIEHKDQLLLALLQQQSYQQLIVFTATRSDTERLAALLKEQGLDATALSADLTQSQRSNIMNAFGRGQHSILVTTDLASRGLDLRNVSMVINFDLPKHADEYIHRIGRTGRAGSKGTTIALVGPKDWRSFERIKPLLAETPTFDSIEGLEATFKGLQPPKPKRTMANNNKAKRKDGSEQQAKSRPTKRIKTMGGQDVGHIPLKRKPRKVDVPDEQDDNIDSED
ncbi:DEAD/DEAH box helicase [Aestuariibacter halophilus]|uniref:DEAD/DEAH box helicase n=1 Tax=Fluctibacter halophilus TaxID=226011 RepID=A0ABS8G4M0_9ALTE|nr:DEAD/DEAH box helicase [Aestuariibacter halophilus]MCC2615454.1 DEAD/DEAH box helicase [Aestuariibacter halophilus]